MDFNFQAFIVIFSFRNLKIFFPFKYKIKFAACCFRSEKKCIEYICDISRFFLFFFFLFVLVRIV